MLASRGRISMLRPPMSTCLAAFLPVRRTVLLTILVFAGCNSKPHLSAESTTSFNIFVRCGIVVAMTSTSSAKRKFVSACNPIWKVPLFFFQLGSTSRNICCKLELRSVVEKMPHPITVHWTTARQVSRKIMEILTKNLDIMYPHPFDL